MDIFTEQEHRRKSFSHTDVHIKGTGIATLSNPNNKSFDKYDHCRVFFSFTDLHDFALERPDATIPDMSIIVRRIENLPKLREILPKYKNIYSYQTRTFRGQRFVWAHKYDCEKLDDFFRDFTHDHQELANWQVLHLGPRKRGPI